jgi:hypothetical protein
VYRLYHQIRCNNTTQANADRIAALFALNPRNATHLIRLIIDATSAVDNKTKWRWTQALRFAWHQRRNWEHIADFLRLHGGIAGCARDFAALTAHPPRGFVAVGGPQRFPRVPLYVDKDLLTSAGERLAHCLTKA